MATKSGVTTRIDFDEVTLLRQRVKLNQKKFNSIEKGMYIRDRVERFTEKKLFDNKMGIMLPESFVIMPEEYQKIKYPSEYRPAIIVASEDLSVNIGFTCYDFDVADDELEATATLIQNMLKRASAAVQFFGEGTMDANHCRKMFYDFRMEALDEAIYNIHFVTLIDGKIVLGMFNCLLQQMDDWFDAFRQMIESVQDLTKKIEKS